MTIFFTPSRRNSVKARNVSGLAELGRPMFFLSDHAITLFMNVQIAYPDDRAEPYIRWDFAGGEGRNR